MLINQGFFEIINHFIYTTLPFSNLKYIYFILHYIIFYKASEFGLYHQLFFIFRMFNLKEKTYCLCYIPASIADNIICIYQTKNDKG